MGFYELEPRWKVGPLEIGHKDKSPLELGAHVELSRVKLETGEIKGRCVRIVDPNRFVVFTFYGDDHCIHKAMTNLRHGMELSDWYWGQVLVVKLDGFLIKFRGIRIYQPKSSINI